jgi:hypothetical protein
VFDFFLAQSAQMFDVEALWGFQERAATASLPSTSRVFLNVSTGGGKTLALLWPVVLDALLAQKAKQFSLSLCFVPLLALQSDLVRRTQSNVMLKDVLHVLSLSVSDDMKTLDALFASKFVVEVRACLSESGAICEDQDPFATQGCSACVDDFI